MIGVGTPGRGQCGDDGKGNHGADHYHFTMGEIDQANNAVNHGVAKRNQRINGTECQSVDQLLQEDIHCEAFRRNPFVAGSALRNVDMWR